MSPQQIELIFRVLAGAAAAWFIKNVLAWLFKFYSTQRWLKTTSIPGPAPQNKLIGE
jgi:hypothetical protein